MCVCVLQPKVLEPSDLQPPKPLWHEDRPRNGQPWNNGPAGPLSQGAHRMLNHSLGIRPQQQASIPPFLFHPDNHHPCEYLFFREDAMCAVRLASSTYYLKAADCTSHSMLTVGG